MSQPTRALSQNEKVELQQKGYLVLPEVLSTEETNLLLHRVESLYAEEGEASGSEFRQEPGSRRLANLADKGDCFVELIQHPLGLRLVEAVLGTSYKLSSLNARSAEPGDGSQPMHVDMGALPDADGFWVCNLIWTLDDFTETNGATEVVPGSHLWQRLPDGSEELDCAPARLEAPRGSLIAINAHLWHRGTRNQSAGSRRALHAFFCRRDKPQQQYQKKMIAKSKQAAFDEQTRWLLALDDPENDALCSGDYQQSGFLKQ